MKLVPDACGLLGEPGALPRHKDTSTLDQRMREAIDRLPEAKKVRASVREIIRVTYQGLDNARR
jgi:hypothetical protein